MNLEKRLEDVEKRLSILENDHGLSNGGLYSFEIELTMPEADIDGLHFNESTVHAVFDKQENGWWQSKDILFLSARNTKNDNSRDILTQYLNSYDFKRALWDKIPNEVGIIKSVNELQIALPKENHGVKKYNGVDWWYWLSKPDASSAANFANVLSYGSTYLHNASGVGGCAPAFCVA